MKVTVGIKALNEERCIAASIASAIEAVKPFGGEVILADSGSTDRTVDVARAFPIRILQLADPSQRCCGVGAQLAFQQAEGEYFYILDGDMVLDPQFIVRGAAYLEAHPDLAAVGGRVVEMNVQGEEYRVRQQTGRSGRNWRPGAVDQLDCGGLYRVAAIRELGYFADRNLHAFEEFELAARLAAKGWKLARIDAPAALHYGHTIGGYRLLARRLRSGYATATGEVLRSAIGRPQFAFVIRKLGHIRHGAVVVVWWAALLALVASAPAWALAALVAPLVALAARRRSLALGLYSCAAWNVSAYGMILGLLRRRVPADQPIAARVLAAGGRAADERRTVSVGLGADP
jgi:glycosyltransferase involved in cell wall biosynthesis